MIKIFVQLACILFSTILRIELRVVLQGWLLTALRKSWQGWDSDDLALWMRRCHLTLSCACIFTLPRTTSKVRIKKLKVDSLFIIRSTIVRLLLIVWVSLLQNNCLREVIIRTRHHKYLLLVLHAVIGLGYFETHVNRVVLSSSWGFVQLFIFVVDNLHLIWADGTRAFSHPRRRDLLVACWQI